MTKIIPEETAKESSADETTSIFSGILSWLKSNWHFLFLAAFIIIGFQLRIYHYDLDPIGYHNMKENDFLEGARGMLETGDYIRVTCANFGLEDESYIVYPFPILIWWIVIAWKIFGVDVGVARLIMIFLSCLNIYLIYLLTMRLTDKKRVGLLAAMLAAILPLGVFFGRNIQPDMPGLTFILLYSLFFLSWCKERKYLTFVLFSFFFLIAVELKLTNAIGLFPLAFFVPYKAIFEELGKYLRKYLVMAGIFLLFMLNVPFWKFIADRAMPDGKDVYQPILIDKLGVPFGSEYWNMGGGAISAFIIDNFTYWFFWIGAIGAMLTIIFSVFQLVKLIGRKERKMLNLWIGFGLGIILPSMLFIFTTRYLPYIPVKPSSYFLIMSIIFLCFMAYLRTFGFLRIDDRLSLFVSASAIAIIPYFMILHTFIWRHNYYQSPFLPLVVISSAFVIYIAATFIGGIAIQLMGLKRHRKVVEAVSLIIFAGAILYFAYPSIEDSTGRQFDTLYYTDVAGKYINEHSQKDERVFLGYDPSGQTYSVLWPADRIGASMPANVTQFIEAEEKLNFRWIFMYGGAIGMLQENLEVWTYVEQNYEVAQVGLVMQQGNYMPLYFLLQRGGNFNLSEMEGRMPILARSYDRTKDKFDLYVVEKD